MKAQHQISFKKRRTGRPRPKDSAKVVPHHKKAMDVILAEVVIGERELKFARALSDTEKHVRDTSLSCLKAWLQDNASKMEEKEIDRLWKALFYCVWMADKRPIISETIRSVVDLADIVGWPFIQGLFTCLIREWFGIDRHRIDKFYELLNVALGKSLEMVLQHEEVGDFTQALSTFLELVRTRVFERARRAGPGVALHICDVYVDRVMKPILTRGKKLPGNEVHKVFDLLMEDLYGMIGSSQGHLHSLGKRIGERILGRIIELVSCDELGLRTKDQRDMVMRASKRVFTVAASKNTSDDVRESLYSLRTDLKAFVTVCDESKEDGDADENEVKG